MLIRENARELSPGAYLIRVGPGAVSMDFESLRRALQTALRLIGQGPAGR
jgi:hypothetical protein